MSSSSAPGPRIRLVAASANPAKLAEIAAILGDEVELLPRPAGVPDVIEDGATFEANAAKKAEAIRAASGLAAVADDTGLEVAALGGEPGVRSARYAGDAATDEENVAKLLASLAGREDPGRSLMSPGVRADSGTTPSSCPTMATAGPSPR